MTTVSLTPRLRHSVTYIDVVEALELVNLLIKRFLVSFLHRERPNVRQSV